MTSTEEERLGYAKTLWGIYEQKLIIAMISGNHRMVIYWRLQIAKLEKRYLLHRYVQKGQS